MTKIKLDERGKLLDFMSEVTASSQELLAAAVASVSDSLLSRVCELIRKHDALLRTDLAELEKRLRDHMDCCAASSPGLGSVPRTTVPQPSQGCSDNLYLRGREMTCDEFLLAAAATRCRLPHLTGPPAPIPMLCDRVLCAPHALSEIGEESFEEEVYGLASSFFGDCGELSSGGSDYDERDMTASSSTERAVGQAVLWQP